MAVECYPKAEFFPTRYDRIKFTYRRIDSSLRITKYTKELFKEFSLPKPSRSVEDKCCSYLSLQPTEQKTIEQVESQQLPMQKGNADAMSDDYELVLFDRIQKRWITDGQKQALLKKLADRIGDRNEDLLLAAVAADNYSAIQFLVEECGAWIHAPDKRGNTPLHLAYQARSLKTMETLLYCGADLNKKNRLGLSVRDLMEQKDDVELFELLLDVQATFGSPSYHLPL